MELIDSEQALWTIQFNIMSLNTSFLYSQTSAKLVIEGLPDLSLNQTNNNIGIVSRWKLTLAGSSELEGKLEHLKSLMTTVLPYARYYMSNVYRVFGDIKNSVSIQPYDDKHKLILRSSKKDIEELEIILDDAELSDLVRCLDSIRKDSRVIVDWEVPLERPLNRKELLVRRSLVRILLLPFFGASFAILTSLAFLLLPTIPNLDKTIESNKEEMFVK